MTTDERMAIVADAASARIIEIVQDLQAVVGQVQRGLPYLASLTVRDASEKLQAVERTLVRAACEDQDGVPTESLICQSCGEHESRCQCADACDVCGRMECDDRHEQDAAAYEPRERF